MDKKINTKGWRVPKFKVVEFTNKKTKYCVGVPVINEGERIKGQLERMKKFVKKADILLFDGGSTDGSTDPKFLKKMGIRALLIGPSGQSRQLRFGLSWALKQEYEGIVVMDGNGKDDVAAIPNFLKSLEEGWDFVQGSRFIKGGKHKNTPNDRVFFNRFVISPMLSFAARFWYTDTPNAFRAYSKKYLLHPGVKPFRDIFERYELLFYLSTRANPLGLKTKEIPVTRGYPKDHVPTKIVGWKRVNDMLNILKISLGMYNP